MKTSTRVARPRPAPGGQRSLKSAVALRPPRYGIDFADNESLERCTRGAAVNPNRSTWEAAMLHAVAERGVRGAGVACPYADRINPLFGSFALKGLQAHLGASARESAERLSASGYVWRGKLAFAGWPTLRTAAHEAAHAVQQQYRLDLPSGTGKKGDRHENLADHAAVAVEHGRSAEPLLKAALGEAPAASATPSLQMQNKITNPICDPVATPWKEITDQLNLDDQKYRVSEQLLVMGYGDMVRTLGDKCARAREVTATLDGGRKGGSRTGDATQTAYGTLGTLMSYLTKTETPRKYNFEGGHLISDEILGDDSYEQYNFAPQRGHLNSPIYRKIEALARDGTEAKNKTIAKQKPPWTFKVEVKYDGSKVSIPVSKLLKLLSIPPEAISKDPPPRTVELEQRVPQIWKAQIDSGDSDFVFKGESTVDPAETSGAALGYRATEAEVLNAIAETLQYIDATYWSMDTMTNAVVGQSPTTRSTGSGTTAQSRHTFTAVQAVPMGQTAQKGIVQSVVPAPTPVLPIKLARSISFSEIPEGDFADRNISQWANEKADEIIAENPSWKVTKVALSRGLHRLAVTKKQFRGNTQQVLQNQKKNREEAIKRARADTHAGRRPRMAAEAFHVLSTQITNAQCTGPW